MFELKNYQTKELAFALREHKSKWFDMWQILNEEKRFHLIPGSNIATIYQIAEYFDVPYKLIQCIDKNHHTGNEIERVYTHGDEFRYLALGKRYVTFEGIRHIQYEYKGFSIHVPTSGSLCYSPISVLYFIPYITDSVVASRITVKLIKYLSKFDSFVEQCRSIIADLKKYEDEELAKQVQKTKRQRL